jgi:perosamine synthetase
MGREFIPISKPSITEREISYVNDAVTSTWISSIGKYIDKFEQDFASFCETKYAVAVMNGTVAIELALRACGIKKDDEVLIPDLSFIATANGVLYTGATPVIIDVEPHTLCLDPAKIEAAITPKTKAIMPVHLYGHPADMKAIMDIAKKHNLKVIEDAAEAHGATAYGRKTGSWGDCATFSFYGNKNFTTGEGGMVTTNDKEIYDRCRFLRDHAMSKEKRYWHPEMGFNFRMTNLQAALGCAQLERAEELMQKRQTIFDWYSYYLADCPGISLNRTAGWATNAYWLMYLQVEGMDEARRGKFMAKLKEQGVDSRPFFYPMSDMPYLADNAINTPVTHKVYQEGINLPTYFDLTEEEVAYIGKTVINVLQDMMVVC